MKKHSFYTLLSNGKTVDAVLKHGYSDGTFYYYNNGGVWCAIHPLVGRSVAAGYSRKIASERAHDPALLDKMNRVIARDGEKLTAEFETAIARARTQCKEVIQ